MRWCDQNGVYYVIGLAKNPVLLREVESLQYQAKRQFGKTDQRQRLLGSFSYGASTWDRKRRVIARIADHDRRPEDAGVRNHAAYMPFQYFYFIYPGVHENVAAEFLERLDALLEDPSVTSLEINARAPRPHLL